MFYIETTNPHLDLVQRLPYLKDICGSSAKNITAKISIENHKLVSIFANVGGNMSDNI